MTSKTAIAWDGAGNNSSRLPATFTVAHSALPPPDKDSPKYVAYKAIAGPARLPFNEWVKTVTCNYCKRIGHIQPDCRKYKADKRRGITSPTPPDFPTTKPTTRPLPARFQNWQHLKILQATIESLLDPSTNADTNDEPTDFTDRIGEPTPLTDDSAEDISALMCTLGLKD